MNEQKRADALNAHAEALIVDPDEAGPLLELDPELAAELGSLFQLSKELRGTLVPVSVPAFKARLRRQLESYAPAEVTIGPSITRQRRMWLAVATAGSMLSIAGILVVLIRRLRPSSDGTTQPAASAV